MAGGSEWPRDSSAPHDAVDEVAIIQGGALATSSTTVRRWLGSQLVLHHISIRARVSRRPDHGERRPPWPRRASTRTARPQRSCSGRMRRIGSVGSAWPPGSFERRRGEDSRRLAGAGPRSGVSDQLLWFASRGSGVVSLVLLTFVAVLGLMGAARWKTDWWPRFLTVELHNNLALLSVMFVAVHVVAAITDPFTSLGSQPQRSRSHLPTGRCGSDLVSSRCT